MEDSTLFLNLITNKYSFQYNSDIQSNKNSYLRSHRHGWKETCKRDKAPKRHTCFWEAGTLCKAQLQMKGQWVSHSKLNLSCKAISDPPPNWIGWLQTLMRKSWFFFLILLKTCTDAVVNYVGYSIPICFFPKLSWFCKHQINKNYNLFDLWVAVIFREESKPLEVSLFLFLEVYTFTEFILKINSPFVAKVILHKACWSFLNEGMFSHILIIYMCTCIQTLKISTVFLMFEKRKWCIE